MSESRPPAPRPNYDAPRWGGQPPRRSPLPWMLGGLGMILLLFIAGGTVGAYMFFKRAHLAPPVAARTHVGPTTASTTTEPGSIPISPQNPSWGSRTAPVTIVEFSDFQCQFCKRSAATLEALKTKYGPDTLRIVWKNNPLPFHKDARPAAAAAMAVFEVGGSEAFWLFHDSAFAAPESLNDESFNSWALAAGVDGERWRAALAAPSNGSALEADIAAGKAANVHGTPAFFVNGVALSGAQPLEKFVEVIEAQKIAARDAVAAGTRPEDVYAQLSMANKAKAPPKEERERAPQDEKTVWRVPIGVAPSRGPRAAPVTIVELGDFQCPFCRRAEAALGDVRARYGDKVRIIWKNNPLPFHPHAEPAAEVAIEAFVEQGDVAFWQMHDLLFENQARLEEADLLTYAKRLNLTGAAEAISTKKHAAWIQSDETLASSLGALGTPSFFINGRRLLGAQPVVKFAKIIDEELRHAAEITARGVAPKDVYEEMQKNATVGN